MNIAQRFLIALILCTTSLAAPSCLECILWWKYATTPRKSDVIMLAITLCPHDDFCALCQRDFDDRIKPCLPPDYAPVLACNHNANVCSDCMQNVIRTSTRCPFCNVSFQASLLTRLKTSWLHCPGNIRSQF